MAVATARAPAKSAAPPNDPGLYAIENARTVGRQLKALAVFASTDPTRSVLQYIKVDFAAASLTLTAVDGYRLGQLRWIVSGTSSNVRCANGAAAGSVLIPASQFIAAGKLLGSAKKYQSAVISIDPIRAAVTFSIADFANAADPIEHTAGAGNRLTAKQDDISASVFPNTGHLIPDVPTAADTLVPATVFDPRFIADVGTLAAASVPRGESIALTVHSGVGAYNARLFTWHCGNDAAQWFTGTALIMPMHQS